MTKGKAAQMPATDTQRSGEASSGLSRLREAARRDRQLRFTNLMHHLPVDMLREAYRALKRDAATGVDGMTWQEYGETLESRLPDLHDRVQSGRYRAQPSRRIWLPKPDGRQRPIGIASLEDKIVQQALVWVLEQIYEEDFVDFSYGFRPGRAPHEALDALSVGLSRQRVDWVLDLDIESFFDRIDHDWLMKFLEVRIGDPRVLRLIRKWLRAGVQEEGTRTETREGTPQGAVISPLLANVYLHYALDLGASRWEQDEAQGAMLMVRYADDVVVGFQSHRDAERFRAWLTERLGKFRLTLHPTKTRLIEFGRFAAARRAARGEGKPETFDFLGFTHICSKTKTHGWFTVRRQTMKKRLRAKIRQVCEAQMRHRHESLEKQGRWLRSVVQGHFNYYAVPGNRPSLDVFRTQVIRGWLQALRRRSHKGRNFTWKRLKPHVHEWIPTARILHPYPSERLSVTHPR